MFFVSSVVHVYCSSHCWCGSSPMSAAYSTASARQFGCHFLWVASLSSGSCDNRLTLLPHGAHYTLVTRHGTFHSYSTMPPHYTTLRTALPQSYLRYTFCRRVEGQRGVKVLSLPRHVTFPSHQRPADSSMFDFMVSGTGCGIVMSGKDGYSWALLRFYLLIWHATHCCQCCSESNKHIFPSGIAMPINRIILSIQCYSLRY